jgi:hypothetical protein
MQGAARRLVPVSSPARLPLTGLPVAGTGRRSAALAAWSTTYLAGRSGLAEVAAAICRGDEPHRVDGLETGEDLPALLADLRARGASGLRLVLPVPGDPRGLPGPGPLSTAALECGEAVVAAGVDAYGLVPVLSDHGSAAEGFTTLVRWRVIPSPAGQPEPPGTLRQVERDLADALREAAQTLTRLDVASLSPRAAERLAEVRAGRPLVSVPRSYPTAAQHLLAQAERLALVLEIAGEDDGAAVDVGTARVRREVLRTFAAAVRRARVAAVNAPLDR